MRVNIFEGLNLNEYIIAKEENCHQNHQVCKSGCTVMVLAARTFIETKVISLPLPQRKSFPAILYDCEKAQRRLLQMPVACVRLSNGVFVTEKNHSGYDQETALIKQIPGSLTGKPLTGEDSLCREDVQELVKSTTNRSELQKLKHAIVATHNLSQRQAHRLGIRNLKQLVERVHDASITVKNIRSKHRHFGKIEQKSFLISNGIDPHQYLSSDSDSSECDSESDDDTTPNPEVLEQQKQMEAGLGELTQSTSSCLDDECSPQLQDTTLGSMETQSMQNPKDDNATPNSEVLVQQNQMESGLGELTQLTPSCLVEKCSSLPQDETSSSTETQAIQDPTERHKNIPALDVNSVLVLDLLEEVDFNWFAFVSYLEPKFFSEGYTQEVSHQFLVDFASQLPNLGLADEDLRLAEQSRAVYLSEMIQKEIRSETIEQEDEADEVRGKVRISDVDEDHILQTLHRIKDKSRKRAKAEIDSSGLFQKESSERTDAVHKRHPHIGEVIEKFVKESNVGADKWRRTGVYTFSGDTKKEKRITFRRLQEKLCDHYDEKISYGTVVQLCVQRNKRRLSSKRFRGVANVKYQKARKGFALKFNPDMKWSR